MRACDHMDRQNLLNASELIPILRRHQCVQLLATGHVHRAVLTLFRRCADHDRPGSEPRGRSRSRRTAASRRSRSSRRHFTSTAGFRVRGSAPSSPNRSRSAASTARTRFRTRWKAALDAAALTEMAGCEARQPPFRPIASGGLEPSRYQMVAAITQACALRLGRPKMRSVLHPLGGL
jgi:hypothetical protein